MDASAILRSTMDFSRGNYLIPQAAYAEVLDGTARAALEDGIRNGDIKVAEPAPEALEKAREAASATGDVESLSDADLQLLALALEHAAAVVSDDYAIQNTAAELGLEVVATSADGIKKHIRWRWVCGGCGKSMDGSGVCGVCGHKARRKPSP